MSSNHPPAITNEHWTLLIRESEKLGRKAELMEMLEAALPKTGKISGNDGVYKITGIEPSDARAIRETFDVAINWDYADLLTRVHALKLSEDWILGKLQEQGVLLDGTMITSWTYAQYLEVSKVVADYENRAPGGKTPPVKDGAKEKPPKSASTKQQRKPKASTSDKQPSSSSASEPLSPAPTTPAQQDALATAGPINFEDIDGFVELIDALILTEDEARSANLIYKDILNFAAFHNIEKDVREICKTLPGEGAITHKNMVALWAGLQQKLDELQAAKAGTVTEVSGGATETVQAEYTEEDNMPQLPALLAINLPKPTFQHQEGMMVQNFKTGRERHVNEVGYTMAMAEFMLSELEKELEDRISQLKAMYQKKATELTEILNKMNYCYAGSLKQWLLGELERYKKFDENGQVTYTKKSVATEHAVIGLRAVPAGWTCDDNGLKRWLKDLKPKDYDFWGVELVPKAPSKTKLYELKQTAVANGQPDVLPFITRNPGDSIGNLYVEVPN